MKSHINYAEIPKPERKRLAREVYRVSRKLRRLRAAEVFTAVVVSGFLVDFILPKEELIWVRLSVGIAGAWILAALFWRVFVCRALKDEVEKLKNA